MTINKIIKKAHDAITRVKGKEYAPTSTEIQKQITMAQQTFEFKEENHFLGFTDPSRDMKLDIGGFSKQMTAVEWLFEKMTEQGTNPYWDMRFIQAKAMEKEQMHKCGSFWRGKENEIEKPIFEQYYNETYNK